MIISFRDKETKKLFLIQKSRKIPPSLQQKALNKLWTIDAAISINDLRIPPSNHLEQLKGNRCTQYSIRINNKWRICFNWIENNAHNIEIIDYHT
jgi:toxin HigB-1